MKVKPGTRPRPRDFIALDPRNYYSRLGVSPLELTESIATLARQKRAALVAKLNAQAGGGVRKEEQEIMELDQMLVHIGTARGREAYDRKYPMNVLLTVQGKPATALTSRAELHGLLTAWLVAELTDEVLLPSPESARLYSPSGISAELSSAAAPFVRDTSERAFNEELDVRSDDDLNAATAAQDD